MDNKYYNFTKTRAYFLRTLIDNLTKKLTNKVQDHCLPSDALPHWRRGNQPLHITATALWIKLPFRYFTKLY